MKYIICNCLGNIDGVNCRILKFELGELGHINTCSTSVALSNLIKDIIEIILIESSISPCQARPEVQLLLPWMPRQVFLQPWTSYLHTHESSQQTGSEENKNF